jgi:hypothetical protein
MLPLSLADPPADLRIHSEAFSRVSLRSSRFRGYTGLRFHREGAKDAKKTQTDLYRRIW